MKHVSFWPVPIAVLATVTAVAVTLLHYVQADRMGVGGGYSALCFGALSVGVLAGIATYFSGLPTRRAIPTALALGTFVSLATAVVLAAALIRVYGS